MRDFNFYLTFELPFVNKNLPAWNFVHPVFQEQEKMIFSSQKIITGMFSAKWPAQPFSSNANMSHTFLIQKIKTINPLYCEI